MFYSKSNNLLFVAIPKTGTTTVHAFLENNFDDGQRHELTIDGNTYKGKDFRSGVLGHARSNEIREVIGDKTWSAINTFAFVRNPYSKLVSAYNYSKRGDLAQTFQMKGNKKGLKRKLFYAFSVVLARALPFGIWLLVYPYRSNKSYLCDNDGVLLVKRIGRMEHMRDDLFEILQSFNVHFSIEDMEIKNTTKKVDYKKYFEKSWVKKIAQRKLAEDLKLMEQLGVNYD